MTAIASTDVTITSNARDRNVVADGGAKIMTLADIAFGDAALTYATGGVPLPAIGNFGMNRALQRLLIQQPYGDGLVYRYDPDNHKIKILTQGFVTGSTAAAAAEDGALVENSLSVEGTPRIPNTIADTAYDMGQMIELPNGTAIPAVSLPVVAIGE